VERTDATFSSSGVNCAAWVYRPEGPGPHPIVVMAHGLSGVRDQRLDAYAERFVSAGLGAIVFDYRFFGSSGGKPRQVASITAQLDDWRNAIAFARTIPWVDSTKVTLFGTSFSGGYVVAIAAEDDRIAAIIAQCPFQDGMATFRTLRARDVLRLTWHGLVDQLGAALGRPPHYVPAVAAPGALGAMTTPDAEPGFAAMTPPGSTWENRVAARLALRFATYRPGRKAVRLRCPALWCIADDDTLCPAEVTARLAARAPRGEVKHYACGHFDIYVAPVWDRVIADQVDFLTRHLLPARVVSS